MFSPIYLSVIPTKKINKILRKILHILLGCLRGLLHRKGRSLGERPFIKVFVTCIPLKLHLATWHLTCFNFSRQNHCAAWLIPQRIRFKRDRYGVIIVCGIQRVIDRSRTVVT